jgi:tetratricopeptide (TPR) repeat protein
MNGTSGSASPGADLRIADAARRFDLASGAQQRITAGLELSELLTIASRHKPALEVLESIQALAADDATQSMILRNFGRVYMHQSRFDEAAQCLGEAIVKLSERAGSLEQFHIYRDLAWIYYRQGFLEQARSYGEGAQLILQAHLAESGPGIDASWELLHHVMALIEAAAGNHQLAITHLEREREVIERCGDTPKLGALYNKLATVHKAQGDFVNALSLQDRALELSLGSGDLLRAAVSYKNLADLHFCLGDLDRSRVYTDKFLELSPAINNAIGGAFGYAARARTLLESGDLPGAEGCYQQALAIARAVNGKGREASILNELAELYCLWRKIQPADDHFRQACQVYTEINVNGSQRLMTVKAMILTARAEAAGSLDQRVSQLQEATRILETVLSKPIIIDDEEIVSAPELELRGHWLLARVQRLLGHRDRSGEALARALALRERLAAQFDGERLTRFLARRQFRELDAERLATDAMS